MKLNSNVLRGTAVAALGGLLFGFDTAVISGAIRGLTIAFHLGSGEWFLPGAVHWTVSEVGVTVSMALWGTVVGAATAGGLGQRYGSRDVLRFTALAYLLSALGCALSPSWSILLAARFLGGLGVGASSVLGPVYIAELAPPALRGRLVGGFQVMVVVGILVAYLSNFVIGLFSLGVQEWRWQLGVAAAPAALFLALLYTIPQSARWLAARHRPKEALQTLQLMGSEHAQEELNQIVQSLHSEISGDRGRLFERFGGRFRYGKPILLAFLVAALNQLSGINAILYYLNDIFAAAGFSRISANEQSVAVGAMNLAATLVGMALIDKLGRKPLLLIGAVGTGVCLCLVSGILFTHAHQSLLVWVLVAYIAFFAISQGAVIWVYIGEVFPNRVRNKGQGLGSSTHWVTNAILSYLFPLVASQWSAGAPFALFAGMMAFQFIIVMIYFPETKQVSLEDLQKKLRIV